jgi:Zn-dependent M16 (insulinase) family peptidase
LTTAGWLGFKTLLPIYLDHLFNPTLTDEACLTEVYHIDGKGKEKGVVFSEMQGIESQSWFISFLKMQQLLYSSTSGYSSETGGLMSELRHLTNDQIQKFHASMYRPDNLCVIITGSVDEEELISIMTDFDNELAPLSSIPSKRPFVDSEPDKPLTSVIISEVEFPDNDESTGELLISWIGPEAGDTLTNVAMDMLGSYFTDSPISLFNKNLIEVENPFATDIDYTTDDYLKTVINFNVNGVPTEKLEELDTKSLAI